MATNSAGKTTFTSILLDSAGYPSVGGNIVIPHVNEDYKLSLYPTQTAADANSSAVWTIDNLPFGSLYESVSNHVKGEVFHIEDDVGASSVALDISTNIGAAWESVGSTGSGADNIWTALDDIPDGATFVELKLFNECDDTAGALIAQSVYLRGGDSSTAANDQTLANIAIITAAGSTATKAHQINTIKVPINSSKIFDCYLVTDGTSRDVKAYLVGFGV